MQRCETCGTDNRDGAKFCKGCARALLSIATDAAATDTHSNRALRCGVCQAIHARDATECAACGHPLGAPLPLAMPKPEVRAAPARLGRWFGLLALLAVASAVVFWIGAPTGPVKSRADGAAAPSASAPAAEPVAAAPSKPVEAAAPVAATLDADGKAHFDELVQREAERAEKARQNVARLAEQEKAAKEARAARVAERQRVEAERQATPPPEPAAPQAATPVASAPAIVPKQSVEQACANTSNFISRDLCRVAACREAGNARDPICLWYRQLEEERRNRLGN